MNHEQNALETVAAPSKPAREAYETPRLTSYGRFQHITGQTPLVGNSVAGPQPEGESEFISEGGEI